MLQRLFSRLISNISFSPIIKSNKFYYCTTPIGTDDTIDTPASAEELEPENFVENLDEEAKAEGNEQKQQQNGQYQERMKYTYSTEKLRELNFDVFPYRIERNWWTEGKRMTFWASWRQAADVRRRRIFAEYGPDRLRYKAMKTNNVLPRAIIDEFAEKMLHMPKAAHPQYCLKMCMFTGRRRGKVNRLRVNRHVFREFADSAKLSGYTRAIW